MAKLKQQARPPGSSKSSQKLLMPYSYFIIISVVGALAAYAYFHWPSKDSTLIKFLPPIQLAEQPKKTIWGSFRSQNYFGLRTKTPKGMLFGMAWYSQPSMMSMPNMRHVCDQGDGLNHYAWTKADGRSFGQQIVNDSSGLILNTDWISHEDTFTARISGLQKNPKQRTAVILYLLKQDPQATLSINKKLNDRHVKRLFNGQSDEFGSYYVDLSISAHGVYSSTLGGASVDITNIRDYFLRHTTADETSDGLIYQLNQQDVVENPVIAAIQLNLPEKFDLTISFNSQNHTALTEKSFLEALNARVTSFEEKIEEAFKLKNKGYTNNELHLGQLALSNMLGSIGYFYGHNKVQLPGSDKVQAYGTHSLVTAVPSRPFFPRGFLWDEGFHNMLIRKFDQELSLEILVSWLNTMNVNGWIPREMILGEEAESRVPAEFVIQRSNVANPPSWFYVIWKMIEDKEFSVKHKKVFEQIYPKVSRWYNWLRQSQKGDQKNTFRWRGRNATIETELNPKTLSSGLDDYPRASHPSTQERHLDLRCWLAIASRVMVELANLFGSEAEKKRYDEYLKHDSDFEDLVEKHWSHEAKAFVDYGLHSYDVELKRVPLKKKGKQPEEWIWKRVSEKPQLRMVDDVFGYNSLYPLIARLIPPNSEYMEHTLNRIRDEKELWTNFGLRSLSKQSPYYGQKNTEHDPPYWRGYIWINLNYLTLSALNHYSGVPGRLQERTQQIFTELRQNIVRNMAEELQRTGYIWENYDDKTGRGRGTHPFTGWSSLVLMIMSDQLDG
ncbi:unnamed protein product, partial [Mesorhabditis belari]|uniref:Mannosyl-oligosaccharide glucosidase n=1 Tax=Mesorhabditis belari TaxID=2138241 RepID=A0AAF3FF24_9BILA